MKLQVQELSNEELIAKYSELKNELFNLRFRLATGQLENPKAINLVKKDIARVLTEASVRKLNVNTNKKPAKKVVKKVTAKKASAKKVEVKEEVEATAEATAEVKKPATRKPRTTKKPATSEEK